MKTLTPWRLKLIASAVTIVIALVLLQMIRLQTIPVGKDLLEYGMRNYDVETINLRPARGNIYDRYGTLLAGNRKAYEVGIDLKNNPDTDSIIKEVALVTDLDYNMLTTKVNEAVELNLLYIMLSPSITEKQYHILDNKIDEYNERAASMRLKRGQTAPSLEGLVFSSHLERTYPENDIASNILGFYTFLDLDNPKPFAGVEENYDNMLSGVGLEWTRVRNPARTGKIPEIPPGASLVLTIDREIQVEVERILDKAVEENRADYGVILVMDPETGEILAMASTPRMNLNEYSRLGEIYPGSTPFNRVVSETYEPGSVFKVLTMAAALDSGTVTPDTVFVDTGSYSYGGITVYNWDGGAWGPQNMTGCMQHSLNVCLSWLADEMNTDVFYPYLDKFGIGHMTNVDVGGEMYNQLITPASSQWFDSQLVVNSFGQGVAVTPLQLATAISAVANDGKMMWPHVVKAVVENGHQRELTPRVLSQPISAETAHTLTDMLTVSLEEEASKALLENYRVAGKTGTGEIPTPEGYSSTEWNASFVGWGPSEDPQFLVYVWLAKPKSDRWGSVVAAPVFRQITERLVILMDIPPDSIRGQMSGQ